LGKFKFLLLVVERNESFAFFLFNVLFGLKIAWNLKDESKLLFFL